MHGGAFALAALCMAASGGLAQSQQPRFEVSSIRPIGQGGPMPFSGEVFLPGGRFRDPGTTLWTLIDMAYDVDDLGLKIVGLPNWAKEAVYAIDATPGPGYPRDISDEQNQANIKAMLRSMLADRFHLKIHQEERRTQVLILQAPKGPAKLRRAAAPVPPEKEGRLGLALSDRLVRMVGEKVTIAQLARTMSLFLKQRVQDRTGLTGYYDFDERRDAPSREGEPTPANTLGPEGLAQLVSVLDQNLGLTLKSETVPAQFWVVDHAELPDEN